MTHVLSVDVGGTKTLLGIVSREGEVAHQQTVATRVGGDDISRVVTIAAKAAQQHRPDAIALGFPEYVDAAGSLTSEEVLTWAHQPREAVGAAVASLGIPADRIVVESDVRLGALGEAVFGAGRGAGSFLYVSLGTGLSCAFVIDGVAWPGARGEAIALGETRAPEGNLEEYVSGSGVQSRYAAMTGHQVTGQETVERALGGDVVAQGILASAGTALGDAIADLAVVLDPALIVRGGGLGSADTPLITEAVAQYRRRTQHRPGSAPVVVASLGDRSGLLGGGVAALRTIDPGFGR
jgi:glucokinase